MPDDEETKDETNASSASKFPMDLRINEKDFKIEKGCVMGLLCIADQTGRVGSSPVYQAKFACDTVNKKFGQVDKNGEMVYQLPIKKLKIDLNLKNPERNADFVIRKKQIELPMNNQYPFAVVSEGDVYVFWPVSLR